MKPAALEPHEISEALDLVHHVINATPGIGLTRRFCRVHGAAIEARLIQRLRMTQIRRLIAIWRNDQRRLHA